jgi:hypothetical protein
MLTKHRRLCSPVFLRIAAACGFCTATSAATTVVEENFNNYGVANVSINGLGSAGAGWAGAWSCTPTYGDYKAGTVLIYGGAGYNAPGNESGTDDGTLAAGSGAGVANKIYRAVDVDQGTAGNQGMTGTIWISCLVNVAANVKDIFLLLDANSVNNAVALRGSTGTESANTAGVPEPVIKYNNGTDATSTATFTAGVTHLFLVKIVMNNGGTGDSVDFWVDPTLGASAPTSAAVYSKSGSDAYGATFDGIGFTFATAGGSVDALRMSNDAKAYRLVTGDAAAGTVIVFR